MLGRRGTARGPRDSDSGPNVAGWCEESLASGLPDAVIDSSLRRESGIPDRAAARHQGIKRKRADAKRGALTQSADWAVAA